MENYKKKVSIRILVIKIIIFITVAATLILRSQQEAMPNIPSFIKGFQIGVFIALELMLLYFYIKGLLALRNEKALKKLHIEENDERRRMIMQKTGALGITICITGLAFATVVAGFFNETVFITLLGATIFTALVKGIFKLYYLSRI